MANKSGWTAARTEPFDFSLRYSNCPVCRYSGATKGSFSQQGCSASATRAGAGEAVALARVRGGRTSAAGARARARRRGELALACVVLASQRRQPRPLTAQALPPPTSRSRLHPASLSPRPCVQRPRQSRRSPWSSAYSAVRGQNSSWQPPARRNQESDLN